MQGYVLDAAAGPGLQGGLPLPSPGLGEALIRVLRSGVCSTDLEMIKGYKDGFQGVLGHEFVGVVEAGELPPPLRLAPPRPRSCFPQLLHRTALTPASCCC